VRTVTKGVWTRAEVRAIVAITVFAFALRSGWLLAAHPAAVSDALASLDGVIPEGGLSRAVRLWDRIRNDVH